MLETKEQKQIFAGSIILVIILGLVSIWHRPNFNYVDTTDYSKKDQSVQQAQAYLDYLKTIKTDPEASKQLFETILTQEDIQKEVVAALQSDQPAPAPVIDEKKIKLGKKNTSAAVSDYLSQTAGMTYAFNNKTVGMNKNLFLEPAGSVSQLKNDLSALTNELNAVIVPPEAFNMQKALLTAMAAYQNLVDVSGRYNQSDYSQNDAIWPSVYSTYAAVNDSTKNYTSELNRLAGKYKISTITITNKYAQNSEDKTFTLPFVNTAHAFLGIPSPSITIGDLPRIIMDSVEQGIESAFLQFMGTMLNKLITQIEKNYKIANFLYYSDALVNAQYTDDYLNKYASGTGVNQLDKQMIKSFIPQFACGKQPKNLDTYFKSKSQVYLGFDPATVSPSDPDYYSKLARVGDFMASPSGWNLYYQDIASSAESAAQQAAILELTSSGLKTPRDISDLSISKSVNNIISAENAGFNSLLALGIDNATSIVTQMVGQLTQSLINQFVFSGVSSGPGGSIGVLKEQALCVDAFQITPVVGISDTAYSNTSVTPTSEDAQAIACSYQTTVTSDCTSTIMVYLNKCLNNSSKTNSQTCSSVAGSAYAKAKILACQPLPLDAVCSQFKTLVGKISH